MLDHYNRHALPFTTQHEFNVKGIGLVGVYVPANWHPNQWVEYWFNVSSASVLHIHAI